MFVVGIGVGFITGLIAVVIYAWGLHEYRRGYADGRSER